MISFNRHRFCCLCGLICFAFTTQFMVLLFFVMPRNHIYFYFADHSSIHPPLQESNISTTQFEEYDTYQDSNQSPINTTKKVLESMPNTSYTYTSCPRITNIYKNSRSLPANKRQTLHVAYDLPLYLFSDGGSGNTWMRVLLEYITGISTGSVFKDPTYKRLFNKDHLCNRGVLVCKAHPIWFFHQVPPFSWKPQGVWETKNAKKVSHDADGLVWIIRNPWHSIWSLYQLRTSDYIHSGKIDIENFDEHDFFMDIYMGKREISLTEKWKLQFKLVDVLLNDRRRKWRNDSSRVVQVKYENILNESTRVDEVLKVLDHLYVNISSGFWLPQNVYITYEQLIQRIKCASDYKTNEATFHRTHDDKEKNIVTLEHAYRKLGEETVCKIWHSIKDYSEPLGYKQLFYDEFRCEDRQDWYNITDIDNVKHPDMARFNVAKRQFEREKMHRKRQRRFQRGHHNWRHR
eukprot:1053493_1